MAHFGNLWFTCLDYIFPSTISITDNNKAVAFSFRGAAQEDVLQNIFTAQACKTGWESRESELAYKIRTAGLLKSPIRLLSLV